MAAKLKLKSQSNFVKAASFCLVVYNLKVFDSSQKYGGYVIDMFHCKQIMLTNGLM